MIKLFTLNRTPSTVDRITPLEGVRSLSVSRPIPRFGTMPEVTFQGAMECAIYDDEAAMLRAHDCRDVAELMARSPGDRCATTINVIIDGSEGLGPDTVKLTSLFVRRADMSRQAFLAYYPSRHAPLVRQTPELPRYVQNYALEASAAAEGGFDAVAELWWPDRDTAVRSWSSDAVQIDQARDCENFIQGGDTLFGDERLLVGER